MHNKQELVEPIPRAHAFTVVLCSSLFESGFESSASLRQVVIIVIQENTRSVDHMVVKVRTSV